MPATVNPGPQMIKYFPLLLVFFLVITGCSRLNCSRLQPLLGRDINLVHLGDEIGDVLIREAVRPLFPGDPGKPVLTVTFVDNNDLNTTSPFGRSLQNHVSSAFVRRGYTVREVKLRRDLFIRRQSGEFMLSRELGLINERQNAQAVIVGTYSLAGRVMYLSARLVNPTTKTVLSTFDRRLCLDDNTLRLLGYEMDNRPESDEIAPPRKSILNPFLY